MNDKNMFGKNIEKNGPYSKHQQTQYKIKGE